MLIKKNHTREAIRPQERASATLLIFFTIAIRPILVLVKELFECVGEHSFTDYLLSHSPV